MTIKQPFMPAYGTGQVLTPAAGSATVAIDSAGRNKQVRLTNTGAAKCYVRIGSSLLGAATVADLCVPAGETTTVTKDQQHTHLSHISATGTTLEVILGEGFGP